MVVSLGAVLVLFGMVNLGRIAMALFSLTTGGVRQLESALESFWTGALSLVAGLVLVAVGRKRRKV